MLFHIPEVGKKENAVFCPLSWLFYDVPLVFGGLFLGAGFFFFLFILRCFCFGLVLRKEV